MEEFSELLSSALLLVLFVVACLVGFMVLVLLGSALINLVYKLKGGGARDKGDDEEQL